MMVSVWGKGDPSCLCLVCCNVFDLAVGLAASSFICNQFEAELVVPFNSKDVVSITIDQGGFPRTSGSNHHDDKFPRRTWGT